MKMMREKWVKAALWAGLGLLAGAGACKSPGGLLVVTTTTSGTTGSGGSGGGPFCGATAGRVPCADGGLCPSFSACVAGPPTTCACLSGYRAVNCAGEACSDGTACAGTDWWCVPE